MQVNYAGILPNSVASERDDSRLARRLASWLSIRDDLERISEIAGRIELLITAENETDQLILESMTWHLVLRYSRCFDSTATGRTSVLGAEVVRKVANPELVAMHEGLIHRRNNTFAHAGGDCSCHLNVHLIELADGPQLFPTFDEEAPGPINDPDHTRAIIELCRALSELVMEKIEKAATAYEKVLALEHDAFVRRLQANAGKHSNLAQQAIVLLGQLKS